MKNGNQKQQRRIRNTFFVIFLKFRGKAGDVKKSRVMKKEHLEKNIIELGE